MQKNITIVVPVYADWSSLKNCLLSLKKNVDKSNKILLVNDCGPEANKLEEKIKEIVKNNNNFEYYKNPKNLGFIKTCNRVVNELDKSNNDILLLNSDTKVTNGFLEEMVDVLMLSSKIASVSPRSNNATLATIPLSSAPQKGIEPIKSYRLFQKIKVNLPRYSEVPTTHGFCMLIRREVIKKYGLFDEVFGKGYGEENDFCMRVQVHGYKNALANRAFVYHLEARSFTPDAKQEMLKRNLGIMYNRWPTYRNQVRDYMEDALEFESKQERKVGFKINEKTGLIVKLKEIFNTS